MTVTQTATSVVFDPGAEPHDPALYEPHAIIKPLASPARFDEEALAAYHRDGFVAVEGVFGPAEVKTAIAALNDLIDRKVPGHPADMLYFESGANRDLDTMTAEARRAAVRKVFRFCKHEPRLDALSRHPNIITIVERILRGPSQMTQDMALLKPPRLGREKPWHQDHAYFDIALEAPIVGVWIALDEATVENGCMHALRRWHQRGPITHFKKRDWQICDTDMLGPAQNACVALPLKPGGAMFFSSLLPHGTPTNHSSLLRRAVQFHYARADAPGIPAEQRMATFGSEGKNVSC